MRLKWSAFQQTLPYRFVMKGMNDWLFNLAGLLAYNLLLAMFPLFLLLIGGLGLALQSLKPDSQQQLMQELARTLPSEVSSGLIAAVTTELEKAPRARCSSWAWSPRSSLARACSSPSKIASPSSIAANRVRPLRRNIMALGMTLLFIVLVPIMFLGSAVPALLTNQIVQRVWHTQTPGFIGQTAGFVGAYLAAFVWLLLIYMLIPNDAYPFRHSWPGAALAAGLFIIYDLFFPWFASALLQPGKYGATAGFLILLLSFFYYFGMLLLDRRGSAIPGWRATAKPGGRAHYAAPRHHARATSNQFPPMPPRLCAASRLKKAPRPHPHLMKSPPTSRRQTSRRRPRGLRRDVWSFYLKLNRADHAGLAAQPPDRDEEDKQRAAYHHNDHPAEYCPASPGSATP